LLIVTINLPFSHRFVTRQVNQVLSQSNVPIQINDIRKILPRSVNIQGVVITDLHGDTIIYAAKVLADFRLFPLLRSKVVVRDVEVNQAIADIIRNNKTQEYDIASAFLTGKKTDITKSEKEKVDWEISINKGELSNISFRMTDSIIGVHIAQEVEGIKLKNFWISILERDILLKSVDLKTADGSVMLTPRLPRKQEKEGPPWNFGIRNVLLNDIDFTFHHPADSLMMETRLGKGSIRANQLDLISRIVDIRKISLAEVTTTIHSGNQPKKPKAISIGTDNTFSWDFLSEAMEVENGSVELGDYSDLVDHASESRVIYAGIDMNIRDFRLDESHAGMKVREMNFDVNNGFSLKKMKGELDSNSENTLLRMEIETGNSSIAMEGLAEEGFFDMILKPGEIQEATLDINRALISFSDISYFIPDLQESPLHEPLLSSPFDIGGSLIVAESVYSLSGFSVNQDRNFNITLDGTTENPFQFSKAKGDLDLEISGIDQTWLERLISGFGIEDTLPDLSSLLIHSNISDTLMSPHITVALMSNSGGLDITGALNFHKESFALDCSFERLSLGELLSIPEIGSFTGKAEITGIGFTRETNNTDFSLRIDTLGYNDYDYSQILLKGILHPGEYEFNMVANDSSLNGDLNVMMSIDDSAFSINGVGFISAQLNNLHFYDDTLAVETRLEANLTKSRNILESDLSANVITLTTPLETAVIQQINASFKTDTVKTMLSAEADFFNIDLQLSIPFDELDSLGQGYKQYFGSFSDPAHIHAVNRVSDLPEINATGKISYHKVLDMFIQDTGFYFTSLDVSLLKSSDENRLNSYIRGDEVTYKMATTGNINASITDSAGIITLKLIADKTSLFYGPEYTWLITGDYTNRSTLTSLFIYDTLDQSVYGIEVAGEVDSNQVVLEIPSQQFILNRDQWQMDSPDLLSIDLNTKTVSPALKMYTDSSFLHMHSLKEDGIMTYKFDLDHVKLVSLFRRGLIPGRPEGDISGSINFSTNDEVGKKIVAGLQLSDVKFSDQDFSDIVLDGSLELGLSDDYSLDLLVKLDSSRVELNGEKNEGRDRNINAAFSHLPIKTIGLFTKEYISDAGGYISGDFNVSTHTGTEQFNGEIRFEDARLKVNMLNSAFRIPHQRILIADEKMIFNNFTVLDTLNKELQVDGFVEFGKNKPVSADLNVSSSKLQVMSIDEKSQAAFTGNVFVDSKFSMKGPLNNPKVDGRIRLSEGTEIFYQHLEDLSLSESEKIVSFVNHTSDSDEIKPSMLNRQSNFNNSSVETIVEIDPTTVINFTLSKRIFNIDLNITGGGLLQYQMLENNQVTLSGRYIISEGAADLKLVGWPNKSFQIAEGGYIRWNGMIENPELRFEAVNKVTTSYLNPVDGKNREVDFNVILQISNQLSDLDVMFTINTPDQYIMSIINTMSPEEQMRQAISILLFEIIDLPGISSSTDYMTQQVNQILASQLNQLTQATIKGVDISFGLDTFDETSHGGSTETKTSLSYEVRKSLLNNRAQIEFSGRMYDDNQQPGATDLSMNNLSFEYRLDSAATKYLKVYNEQTYEDVFEGEVIKTGIGITYRKRYKFLRDIWKRKGKSKKARKSKK